MTLTISVYEKRGLCRGPAIQTASFRAVKTGFIILDMPLSIVSAPGPLDPAAATYRVLEPALPTDQFWTLRVGAPGYESWSFEVRFGETHDVWLPRRPR